MQMELTDREFRRLLDLVYVGNWVMNSIRGDQRIPDYDQVESRCFSYCLKTGMYGLFEMRDGEVVPSVGFENGGIQDAIMDYEDAVLYSVLAEELARRDLDKLTVELGEDDELRERYEDYLEEFDCSGLDNVRVDGFGR